MPKTAALLRAAVFEISEKKGGGRICPPPSSNSRVNPALAEGGGGRGVFRPPHLRDFTISPAFFLELAAQNLAYVILHQCDNDGASFVKIGYIFLKK